MAHYQIIKGRRYDKLVKVTAGDWREAIAFIDQGTGDYRFSASWSKPGRFMTKTEIAYYAPLVEGAQQ